MYINADDLRARVLGQTDCTDGRLCYVAPFPGELAGFGLDPAESLRQSQALCESEGGVWYERPGEVGCDYTGGSVPLTSPPTTTDIPTPDARESAFPIWPAVGMFSLILGGFVASFFVKRSPAGRWYWEW